MKVHLDKKSDPNPIKLAEVQDKSGMMVEEKAVETSSRLHKTKHTYLAIFRCQHCKYSSANKLNFISHNHAIHGVTIEDKGSSQEKVQEKSGIEVDRSEGYESDSNLVDESNLIEDFYVDSADIEMEPYFNQSSEDFNAQKDNSELEGEKILDYEEEDLEKANEGMAKSVDEKERDLDNGSASDSDYEPSKEEEEEDEDDHKIWD